MLDFKITKTGDIMITDGTRAKKDLNVFFNVGKSNPLKISFYVNEENRKKAKNEINIKFGVDLDEENESQAIVADETETKKQLVKNAIYTAKTSLKVRTEFGSMLETIRHERLFEKTNLLIATKIIREAVNYALPFATVNVEPHYKAFPVFKEGLKITVYDNSKLIHTEII